MTKKEILALHRLETDGQLADAIEFLDVYLDSDDFDNMTDVELAEFDKLSDLIYEYEERTDIMNR